MRKTNLFAVAAAALILAVRRAKAAHSKPRSTQLWAMDDHILKDIGLTRDEILHETWKPFWR